MSPAYVDSPFQLRTTLLPGEPAYSFGSLDLHNPGTKINIATFGVTSDVGTITGTVVEGPSGALPNDDVPIAGDLISIEGVPAANGGELTAVVIHSGTAGSGFAVNDTLAVTGGGGTGGVIKVASESGGVPETYDVVDAGAGYTSGDAVSLTVLTGTGTAGTADITAGDISSTDNLTVLSYSYDTTTGIATVTFTIDIDDVTAGPASGFAVIGPTERAEPLIASTAGQQFAMQAFQGLASNSRDLSWVVSTPSAPDTFTVKLQVADVDQDAEYTDIDTTSAAGLKITIGVRANFVRLFVSAVDGGTDPTIIGKILE